MPSASMVTPEELLRKVESVKNMLVARATGGIANDEEYQLIRYELIADMRIKEKLPRFVHSCRTLDEFWGYIKPMYAHYEERRQYLRCEFDPLLTQLETWRVAPSDDHATHVLQQFDSEHVTEAWRRALERKGSDPEGAITAARTLLEAVCKHILEDKAEPYSDKSDLKTLYNQTAKLLNLSPSQHAEDVFRQILGGCHSVVEGLGSLRNRLSDAHGRGRSGVKPLPRHAELAVNLAGSMAIFLVATWESVKPSKAPPQVPPFHPWAIK